MVMLGSTDIVTDTNTDTNMVTDTIFLKNKDTNMAMTWGKI